MTDLIRVKRDDDTADIRLDWLDEWASQGWAVEATPLDLTREGIAAMEKPELLELLEAHGWDGDKRLGVDKLREALTGIVFVEA